LFCLIYILLWARNISELINDRCEIFVQRYPIVDLGKTLNLLTYFSRKQLVDILAYLLFKLSFFGTIKTNSMFLATCKLLEIVYLVLIYE